MLRRDFAVAVEIVEVCPIRGRDDLEGSPMRGSRQTEHLGKKGGGRLAVARPNDGVIEFACDVVLPTLSVCSRYVASCGVNSTAGQGRMLPRFVIATILWCHAGLAAAQ